MGKALIVAGALIGGLGLLIMLEVPLARLPGDIVYRRGNLTIYLPIATSLVLSIILTLVVTFIRR